MLVGAAGVLVVAGLFVKFNAIRDLAQVLASAQSIPSPSITRIRTV
jgi:hypothetical protein